MPVAMKQFDRFPYLHLPKRHQQRWLKALPGILAPGRKGRAIGRLDRMHGYTPDKLKAWLDNHGLADGYAAIFTAPTRSPRQW